jgi:hypothetical protein
MNESIRRLSGAFQQRVIGLNPRRIVMSALAVGLALMTSMNSGVALASDPVGCAYDRPCFDNVYNGVNDALVIQWKGQDNYDKYHLRWNRDGGPVHSHVVRGGSQGQFVIRGAWKSTRYHFAVQGCHTVLIGKDDCSPWEDGSFRTNNI